ncbi:hypothetical protein, partial [Rhizobium leguminosarum]|uniref:hypothetical protein n=1 Tax=Rhizobium leguminosarum TaxID=384 RepID=UPI003F9E2668
LALRPKEQVSPFTDIGLLALRQPHDLFVQANSWDWHGLPTEIRLLSFSKIRIRAWIMTENACCSRQSSA